MTDVKGRVTGDEACCNKKQITHVGTVLWRRHV